MTRASLGATLALGAVMGVAATAAVAAPAHKILVLPTDGNADAATRGKLTAQVARLAHRLDGQVSTGDATFADTALAVGCAPDTARCGDEVITTLGVDELVWATATRAPDGTRVVVHRAARGSAARERGAAITTAAPADRLDAEFAPLFGPPEAEPPPAPTPVAAPVPRPAPAVVDRSTSGRPTSDRSTSDRNLGIAIGVGAGVAVLLGGALWLSYADLQDQIDAHPTRTRGDLDDLLDLEGRAENRAVLGDVFVIAGIAAGGIAAYFLFRDHHAHGVAIAPTPLAHGGGLTLTFRGDL